MSIRKLIFLLPVIFLLTGCLSKDDLNLSAPETQNFKKIPYAQRIKKLKNITLYLIDGKAGITANKKTDLFSFDFRGEGRYSWRLLLAGPGGIDATTLESYSPHEIIMWKNSTNYTTARSVKELLQKEFGWHIPIGSFFYWAVGLPEPGPIGSQTFDQWGHLQTLHQKGWYVQFKRYINQTDVGVDVPTILEIQGYGIKIKIAIKDWSVYVKSTTLYEQAQDDKP